MRKSGRARPLAAWVLVGTVCAAGCSVPHRVVRQEDAAAREWNDPALERRVLIASRSSGFKDDVLERVEAALREEPGVYVKVVGVDGLAGEDASRYGAVVIVGTCMAWNVDPKIRAFLRRQSSTDHIVVVTTSATGEWTPKEGAAEYDTITSASEAYDPGAVAGEILDQVRRLLQGPSSPRTNDPRAEDPR